MQKRYSKYLAEFVYGGIDGAVTTLAVMAGAVGASLGPLVILILGIANLLADGFSMGVSSFLSTRSANELAAAHEHAHPDQKSPLPTGLATFSSFVVIGLIPLLPFILAIPFPALEPHSFTLSAGFTALAFIIIGAVRGHVVQKNKYVTALTTLAIGGIAAAIAFFVGAFLRDLLV